MTATRILQRSLALERANHVRFARVALKNDIANGLITAASVILDPPEEAEGWAIGKVLCAQHRWGVERAGRFLARVGMSEMKSLGSLTDRQRQLVAKHLGDEHDRVGGARETMTRSGSAQ